MAPSVSTPSTSKHNNRNRPAMRVSSALLMPWIAILMLVGLRPARLLPDRPLTLQHALLGAPQGLLRRADVANQRLQAVRLQGGGLVRSFHGSVERKMPLDGNRAQGDCRTVDAADDRIV